MGGSIKKALKYLRGKEIVGLFPEGGRTRTGKIMKVKHKGPGILALMTKTPIVPMRIHGAYDVWNFKQKLPKIKRSIAIHIGKAKKYDMPFTIKNAKKATQDAMKEVKKL